MPNPPILPEGWFPSGYFPPGYFPGVSVPEGAPMISGLRDKAAFDALEAILDSDLDFRGVTFGGPYDVNKLPSGRGPFLHIRPLGESSRDDANPTLKVRTVDYELTITWRGNNREEVEDSIMLIKGVCEAGLTGQSLGGFCVPHLTKIKSSRFIDRDWPTVRMTLQGQFVYEWDYLYGRTTIPFVPAPPPGAGSGLWAPEAVRLNLIAYLRSCQALAHWSPVTVAGWEGEEYPYWPPRPDELPYLRVEPGKGRASWYYEDAEAITMILDLTLATAGSSGKDFAAFYGGVFAALFPQRSSTDYPNRDACFLGYEVQAGGRGEMMSVPTVPRPLGFNPYGLIGTAQVSYTINVPSQ